MLSGSPRTNMPLNGAATSSATAGATTSSATSTTMGKKGLRLTHDGALIKASLNDVGSSNQYFAQHGNQDDPAFLVSKLAMVEKDMDRRQESYVARERAYKARIDELEEELASMKQEKTGWMAQDSKISKLRTMQGQILNNIELVQDRTARILQEQERDLLKAFRARLYDVQTELEKEKSKKDDGAGAWIDRCNVLTAELEWSKGVADRLERVNQALLQDNSRLKSEFASQEEDRNFIITQLVSVKKENARLRTEYSSLDSEYAQLKIKMERNAEDAAVKAYVGGRMQGVKLEADDKNKDISQRLKRLLAEERKSLQQLRQTYAAELKSRSELELLLRQCVDDVRKEIARRKMESGGGPSTLPSSSSGDLTRLYNRLPGSVPVEEFTREDRERTLELLLSQERVVTMLYAKAFPVVNKNVEPVSMTGGGVGSASSNLSYLGIEDLLDNDSSGNENTNVMASSSSGILNNNIGSGGGNHTPSSRPLSSRLGSSASSALQDATKERERLPSIASAAVGAAGGGGGIGAALSITPMKPSRA